MFLFLVKWSQAVMNRDEIDTSAASFKQDLDSLGDMSVLNVHINSPGGSVFEGVAICSMLKQHKAFVNVYIDGLACFNRKCHRNGG